MTLPVAPLVAQRQRRRRHQKTKVLLFSEKKRGAPDEARERHLAGNEEGRLHNKRLKVRSKKMIENKVKMKPKETMEDWENDQQQKNVLYIN